MPYGAAVWHFSVPCLIPVKGVQAATTATLDLPSLPASSLVSPCNSDSSIQLEFSFLPHSWHETCKIFSQSIAGLCSGWSLSPDNHFSYRQFLLFIWPDHTDGLGSHCEWLIQATPSLCLSFTVHNKNAFYKCLSAWPYLFHYWISSHFCYSSSQDYVVISVRCSEPPLYWQSCPALCDQSVPAFTLMKTHARINYGSQNKL